jgi:hypothetical protein
MTKTLVALVLIAGGILLVTRLVDTDKPVPARLSPPTSADQMSEARSRPTCQGIGGVKGKLRFPGGTHSVATPSVRPQNLQTIGL